MSTNVPDRWVVVKFIHDDQVTLKVFAGWVGGFTTGDSWRLNSGIVRTVETDDAYEFYGHSGSVYICKKSRYGMSLYMLSIYEGWERQVLELPGYALEVDKSYAPQ